MAWLKQKTYKKLENYMRVYKYNYYSTQLPIIWLCVKWFSAKVHLKSNIALVKKIKIATMLAC